MHKKIISPTDSLKTQHLELLESQVPHYRQAYSDRTAWLMACMSELAYVKFNPLYPNKFTEEAISSTLQKLSSTTLDPRVGKILSTLSSMSYDHVEEKKLLESELSELNGAILLDTFDCNGTQAMLVELASFNILAFRGTEATSLKDIKADIKAVTTRCETGGQVHSGFKDAFDEVCDSIVGALKAINNNKPLMITGHSLGGALATIAAKRLTFKNGIAGCYTFGSPRVGDDKWISTVKTPIYRVVNAADVVTMLPPNSIAIESASAVFSLVPYAGEVIKNTLLSKFNGYIHGGNMRYLTNCEAGNYANVKLLYSVSFLYRIKALLMGKLPVKKLAADHSISIYRQKLALVALQRKSLGDQTIKTGTKQ
ncbi:lipase family protein [Moritella viscosa]|uniref:lipase family protein n=1 Tax=Moritella viscosa TaxID=80854 RepID=UPI00091C2F30|nr:lipase family protein [Moritella viscosa]SGZ09220.1 Lipase family protein [Moritella viscosa]